MATEDKLNMSLDAMIAKSSKSQPSKKAGGRKVTGGGKASDAKLAPLGVKQAGNGARRRNLGGKGSVQKRTSAPIRRRTGPNPNNFLREPDSVNAEPDRYDDHMRPRVQRDGLYNVTRQIMDNNNPEKWQHDKYEGPVVRRKPSIARSRNDTTGFKLQITNLDHKVSNDDIKELFKEFGNLKHAGVAVSSTGASQGRAEVVYHIRAHALAAQKKYNKVCLDGKPMHIELVSPAAGAGRTVEALSSGIRISRGDDSNGRTVSVGRGGRGGMRSSYPRGNRSGGYSGGNMGPSAMDED